MSRGFATAAAFRAALAEARAGVERLRAQLPDDRAVHSVQLQLAALDEWTESGAAPSQDQKDRLNFGQIASREIDDVDSDLAQKLYALASHVIYW